jgi:hypothetical protein
MKHKIGLLLAFVCLGFFWACSEPETNKVEIVSVSPTTDNLLKAGEIVDISATVKYSLKEKTGNLSLVVQEPGKGLPIAYVNETIKKGFGKKTLTVKTLVPLTGPITVYTPMTPEGQKETKIVDSRTFKVNIDLTAEEMKKAKFAWTKNEIEIISTSLKADKILKVGEKVTISVTVNYKLKEDNGEISMLVQNADDKPIANVTELVKKGSGKMTLKKSIIVPETKFIRVFTPLSAKGEMKTSIVDSRTFKVK